jgi:citrate lyase alpha subunit
LFCIIYIKTFINVRKQTDYRLQHRISQLIDSSVYRRRVSLINSAVLEKVLDEHVCDAVVWLIYSAVLEKVLDEHVSDAVAHQPHVVRVYGGEQVHVDLLIKI